MDYIIPTQFEKQSEKVQKVLTEYFFDNIQNYFSFVTIKNGLSYSIYLITNITKDEIEYLNVIDRQKFCCNKDNHTDLVPLCDESFLRNYIEEKTDRILISDYLETITGYSIGLLDKKSPTYGPIWYESLGQDLLQAYWQVACKIA